MTPAAKVGVALASSLWLVMAGWNLIDLLDALGDPGVGVDTRRLVVVIAAASVGLPVGGLLGVLLGWLGRVPRLEVRSQVVLALQGLGTLALGVTGAMAATVTQSGSASPGPLLRVVAFGAGTGLFAGFGLLLVATYTWRALEEATRTPEPAEPSSPLELLR